MTQTYSNFQSDLKLRPAPSDSRSHLPTNRHYNEWLFNVRLEYSVFCFYYTARCTSLVNIIIITRYTRCLYVCFVFFFFTLPMRFIKLFRIIHFVGNTCFVIMDITRTYSLTLRAT